jgi:hypothetical protein
VINNLKMFIMRSKKQAEPALTFESIMAGFKETREQIKELVKSGEKANRRLEKTEKMMDKSSQRLDKMYEESRKEMKELNQQLGGISNSNGEVAENYFYNALRRDKTFINEKFDQIKRNLSYNDGDKGAEFDIILFNGKSAALIEVKYNAKPENISVRRIISRVAVFKKLFPEYQNHKIYLAVAAMTFRKDLEQRLHRNGIATIRQLGKKMVVYDKEIKVF